MIKRIIILTIALATLVAVVVSCSCFAQKIKGRVNLNPQWKPVVYLIEVSNYRIAFGGSNQSVTDSIPINQDGYFVSNQLKKNTLYRLNVIPISSKNPGAIIQDGVSDNYAFFCTNESNDDIYFSGDISSFFRTYHAVCVDTDLNALQKQINSIRATKVPVLNLMGKLGKEMETINPSDSTALINFRMDAINKIQQENANSNLELKYLLDSFSNPLVIALGLIFDGVGVYDVNDDILRYKNKLTSYQNMPLIQSIYANVSQNKPKDNLSFFSKEYRLIDGKYIKMDTIRSQFILLDFWASWCMPCRQSIRTDLKHLTQKFKERDLRIIGINIDNQKDDALKTVKNDKNENKQIWEGNSGELAHNFNVINIPTYILINKRTKESWELNSVEMVSTKITNEIEKNNPH